MVLELLISFVILRIASLGDADGCGTLFQNIGLAYVDVGGEKRMRATGCGYTVENAITLTTDDWYLFVITFNASDDTYTMYLNNTFLGTGSLGVLDICGGVSGVDCEINLGTYTWSKAGFWEGRVDDYRIITQVLNSSQLDNLWNESNGNNFLDLDLDPTAPPSEPDTIKFTTTLDGNATVRETSLQEFNITFVFNSSAIADFNVTADFNSTQILPITETTTVLNATHNQTLFNTSFNMPLIQVNATTHSLVWNITIGHSNESVETPQENFSVESLWAYFLENTTTFPVLDLIETQTLNFNATFLNTETVANVEVNFTVNATRVASSIVINNTFNETWGSTSILPSLGTDVSNISFNFTSSIFVAYNGTTYEFFISQSS